MKRVVICTFVAGFACPIGWAQDSTSGGAAQAVRERIRDYVAAFNENDAAAVAAFWAQDAVSLNEETGERVSGRDALEEDFREFFQDSPGARLTGSVDHLRMVQPDVAMAEGQVTLFTPEGEPAESAFTAVLVEQDGQWLISSSQERPLPTPPSSYDALKELEWLVGVWRDESGGGFVNTTVRWSPSRAFLIRSFSAEFPDSRSLEGTQVIGWDPAAKQIRCWTFSSDGSFGEGTVSKNGDDWIMKVSHVLSDGRIAAGTHVVTRLGDDAFQVQKIGQTIDGEPQPTDPPVRVVRAGDADAESSAQGDAP